MNTVLSASFLRYHLIASSFLFDFLPLRIYQLPTIPRNLLLLNMANNAEPDQMAIPLSGLYRAFYQTAQNTPNIEYSSSNLFSNLILRDIPDSFILSESSAGSAENRRSLDHKFQFWHDIHGLLPLILKESKAEVRGKDEVEQQTFEGLLREIRLFDLTHLYGLSTIGTTFRAWTMYPNGKMVPFDDDSGYQDIAGPIGTQIWNSFVLEVLDNRPCVHGSGGPGTG